MRGRLSVTYKPHSLCMGQCIEFQKTGQILFVGAIIGHPKIAYTLGNGTPGPSCHPSDGSAVSSPQGEPIVSVADTKKYAIRRGDHRSPENRIHFVGNGTTTSFFAAAPSLRATSPQGEAFKAHPLRGAVVKRLRSGEQQFNIKKAVIH